MIVVSRDAMVLGSGGSVDQGTPTAPSLEDTTETSTFQQVPQQHGVPKSTFLASGFQESNSGVMGLIYIMFMYGSGVNGKPHFVSFR